RLPRERRVRQPLLDLLGVLARGPGEPDRRVLRVAGEEPAGVAVVSGAVFGDVPLDVQAVGLLPTAEVVRGEVDDDREPVRQAEFRLGIEWHASPYRKSGRRPARSRSSSSSWRSLLRKRS